MYTLYYLLFNTVYIKNIPACFEPCHSSSSGTQLLLHQLSTYGVSATSWSLVQRSPTECGVSKTCDREASKNEAA
jgi:hypothetical protein